MFVIDLFHIFAFSLRKASIGYESLLCDEGDDGIIYKPYKIYRYEQHPISILADPDSQRCGIGNGMVLLPRDDEGRRRYGQNERDCGACQERRYGLSEAAIQGGGHRFRGARHYLRFHGLRTESAESVGAFRIPYRR